MTKHIFFALTVSLFCSRLDAVETPPAADDYLQYDYHTNFKSTQAKIWTPEEGFNLWMSHHNNLK